VIEALILPPIAADDSALTPVDGKDEGKEASAGAGGNDGIRVRDETGALVDDKDNNAMIGPSLPPGASSAAEAVETAEAEAEAEAEGAAAGEGGAAAAATAASPSAPEPAR